MCARLSYENKCRLTKMVMIQRSGKPALQHEQEPDFLFHDDDGLQRYVEFGSFLICVDGVDFAAVT